MATGVAVFPTTPQCWPLLIHLAQRRNSQACCGIYLLTWQMIAGKKNDKQISEKSHTHTHRHARACTLTSKKQIISFPPNLFTAELCLVLTNAGTVACVLGCLSLVTVSKEPVSDTLMARQNRSRRKIRRRRWCVHHMLTRDLITRIHLHGDRLDTSCHGRSRCHPKVKWNRFAHSLRAAIW